MLEEADRLAALRRHDLLDTPPEPMFDRLVEHVRAACRVPVALVSLVDADRQWFKARAGVELCETPRDTSVCSLAIRQQGLFEIEDLAADPRTAAMTLVTGEAGLRFYAGMPLVTRDGAVLGALCAIDHAPRPGGLSAEQRATLALLAEQVVTLIEMRTALAGREQALAQDERLLQAHDTEVRYHAIIDSAIDSGITAFDEQGVVTSWSKGAERLFGWTAEEMLGGPADKLFVPEDRAAGVPAREFVTAAETGRASDERWHLRKDGSRFYAHGAMTPLRGGRAHGFVKSLRDVTAEHATRTALAASREKLELAAHAARLGQYDYRPRDGHLEWDDRCRELFGLAPGVPVSYEGSFLAGLHPDDREHAAAAVQAALVPGGDGRFDVEYRTVGIEDGIERHVHAQGIAFFEAGEPARLIGTVQDVTPSRRAQAELRETEERLRLAVRATNDAIWDWDLLRDRVQWNDAITSAYGHRLEDVGQTGAWWLAHIHPDDRARIEHSIHAVVAGRGMDWTGEYRFRRGDGRYADVRDRGSVLRDAGGRAVRMLGAMLDQTERKAVERRLQREASGLALQVEESRAEIERLWRVSPDLLVAMDADGRYLRTNPAWQTLLGHTAEELLGLGATALAHPDEQPATQGALELAQADRLPGFENRVRHRDGSYRWFSWVTAKSGGEIFAIGRDVTDEKAKAATLRLYRNIVESDESPIVAFDAEHRVIAFNRAHGEEFFRVFGHRAATGEVLPELFPPEQAATLRALMDRALRGEAFTVLEEFGDPERARPYFEISYAPLFDDAGRIIGAFHHAKDVSSRLRAQHELERAQDALRQSQKVEALGQLTGSVAHDFNNLLTVIRGSVDLLARPNVAEPRRERYIKAISDTVDRATKLTSQLLAFARRSALQVQAFDVKADIAALEPVLRTLTGSRIDTRYELGDAPCWVETDPNQFDTAIVNLAVNARDAMGGEGRLVITVAAVERVPAIRSIGPVEGPHVLVSVVDTGSGIAPDQIAQIFEPFFTTKKEGHGTGLGLSQVYGFVKQSHGNVAVDSTPGAGTTFRLYLPRVAPVVQPEADAAPRRALHPGACVLVVEDAREVGEFAIQALAELGYRSHWEPDADSALARLAETPEAYDAVFTDVVMPGRSGIELAKAIRARHPQLPVLLASGYSHVLAEHGSSGFPLLHKPYSLEDLGRALQRVLEVPVVRAPEESGR